MRSFDPVAPGPARLVVLVSGSGSNLQALLDASRTRSYGADVVAVGADRRDIPALQRASGAAVPTFVLPVADFADRSAWDSALTERVASYRPDLVVLAGFLKLTGAAFLARFGGRTVNTHPALLPAFPGMRAPADALLHGVRVTGATLFVIDDGVDTGPIVAQGAVDVEDDDDVQTLHERIKTVERGMLVESVGRMVREGYSIDGRRVRFGR